MVADFPEELSGTPLWIIDDDVVVFGIEGLLDKGFVQFELVVDYDVVLKLLYVIDFDRFIILKGFPLTGIVNTCPGRVQVQFFLSLILLRDVQFIHIYFQALLGERGGLVVGRQSLVLAKGWDIGLFRLTINSKYSWLIRLLRSC